MLDNRVSDSRTFPFRVNLGFLKTAFTKTNAMPITAWIGIHVVGSLYYHSCGLWRFGVGPGWEWEWLMWETWILHLLK